MRPQVYPETRGSHLAGQREREKARKKLRRIERRKRERRESDMQQTNLKMVKPTPKRHVQFKSLPRDMAGRLIDVLNDRGLSRCSADMRRHDSNCTGKALDTRWRVLRRKPERTWSNAALSIWKKLDEEYAAPHPQQRVPVLDVRPTTPPAPPPVPPAPPVVAQAGDGGPLAMVLQAVQQMNSAIMTLATAQLQPPQPMALPAPEPEPTVKDFPDLSTAVQRGILNAMHRRYAEKLLEHGAVSPGSNGISDAWNVSYDAYDREYGLNVRRRASERSDGVGHRCRPLDIIEEDENLVRFFEVVRRTWEK